MPNTVLTNVITGGYEDQGSSVRYKDKPVDRKFCILSWRIVKLIRTKLNYIDIEDPKTRIYYYCQA